MRTLTLSLDDELDTFLRAEAARRGTSIRDVLLALGHQAARAAERSNAAVDQLSPEIASATDQTPPVAQLAAPQAAVAVDTAPPAEPTTTPETAPPTPEDPVPEQLAVGEISRLADGLPLEEPGAAAVLDAAPVPVEPTVVRPPSVDVEVGALPSAAPPSPEAVEDSDDGEEGADESDIAADPADPNGAVTPRRRRRRRSRSASGRRVPPVAAVNLPATGVPPEVVASEIVVTATAARVAAAHGEALADHEEELDDELPRFDVRAIPQHPVETIGGGFAELGLSESLVARLREIEFHHPTPIQAAVIPAALAGRDVIGLAETGSGKTAAFVLPIAEHLRHGRGVRGLILAPTRELALQTQAFLDVLGKDRGLTAVSLVGGLPLGPQIDRLRKKPDVVVATPGRLVDHLERGNVRLDGIERLVIDEADHMLDLGFLPQIQRILLELPVERQTLFFSATMPPPIARLTSMFLTDPVKIDITPVGRTAAGISHRLYLVNPEDKKACLFALLNQELGSTLVFIRRRSDAEWLTRVLEREGHRVARIHSDLTQAQRIQALTGFRDGRHRILVATDVASRGIDVPAIRHVVNFDIPESVEDYIHRAGRTARGTALGIVSTIATMLDKPLINEIEHSLGSTLPRCTVGGVPAYVEARLRPTVRRRRLL